MARYSKGNDGLTALQRRFVMHLLADPAMNGTAAAKKAGYAAKNASRQAHDLLKLPQVRAAIEKAMLERSERTEVYVDQVIRELAIIAFSNPDDFEVEDGELRVREGCDPALMRSISSVKRRLAEHGTEIEFRFWDKGNALRMLAAHLNICTPKSDVTVKGSLFDLICEVEEEEALEAAEAGEDNEE